MLKIKTLNSKYSSLIGIVHIYTTFNNTLITISNLKGHTLICASSGFLGLAGSKRSTSYAGQIVANMIGKKVYELGIRFLQIRLKGFGNSRKSVLKGLVTANLKIISLKDITPIAHNGCRSKKKRRI